MPFACTSASRLIVAPAVGKFAPNAAHRDETYLSLGQIGASWALHSRSWMGRGQPGMFWCPYDWAYDLRLPGHRSIYTPRDDGTSEMIAEAMLHDRRLSFLLRGGGIVLLARPLARAMLLLLLQDGWRWDMTARHDTSRYATCTCVNASSSSGRTWHLLRGPIYCSTTGLLCEIDETPLPGPGFSRPGKLTNKPAQYPPQ